MPKICIAKTPEDLAGILLLQQENLAQNVTNEEKLEHGFVMVTHQLADLRHFSKYAPQLILKDEEKVSGYLLAMNKFLRESVPMLKPMFEQIDQLFHQGIPLKSSNYLIVGQVCIGKGYRGKGFFDELFSEYRNLFEEEYDYAITEIATSNTRSLQAHLRVGFEIIHTFQDEYQEWSIVLWNWK